MTKHIHADLMMQYAKDAMESETPWDNWEIFDIVLNIWINLYCTPSWFEDVKYRRKQKRCYLNGIEVPELGYPVGIGSKYQPNVRISINEQTVFLKDFESSEGAQAYAKALIESIKEEIK